MHSAWWFSSESYRSPARRQNPNKQAHRFRLAGCPTISSRRVGSFWTSGITLDDQKGRGINSHQEEGRTVHSHLGEIALKRNIKIRTFPDLFKDVQIGQARIRLLHPTGDFLEKESRNDLNKFSLVFDITQGIYVASICLIT